MNANLETTLARSSRQTKGKSGVSDRYGNNLAGASVNAASLYDKAIFVFNIFCGDPISLLNEALEDSPNFAMAMIAKAHLFLLATEPESNAIARRILHRLKTMPCSEREQSHLNILDLATGGNWTNAAIAADHHNTCYPHDLLAVQSGHMIDFFRGNARNLRDRIHRVLHAWSPNQPGYSILLGMQAFGLEECGDYARAEDVGRQAIETEPADSWAHHAVTHVLEMQGRYQDGLTWMQSREPHWAAEGNFFQVHNWWHRALFHLESGDADAALALYDKPIRGGKSDLAVDMIDASALLWRLHLTGVDVGNRWEELSCAWDEHADGELYAFNDWHAAMAYLGAGQMDKVIRILDAMSRHTVTNENTRWAQDTGRALIKGFQAFFVGNHEQAIEQLHSARYIANSFGGSHAQRDIIDWTLTEAAIRNGKRELAVLFANERFALKPHSPVNKLFLNRANGVPTSL